VSNHPSALSGFELDENMGDICPNFGPPSISLSAYRIRQMDGMQFVLLKQKAPAIYDFISCH
jgi:hypothetical protein